MKPRFEVRTNPLFYLLVAAYALLIGRMTYALWFGDGINVYASYSDAADPSRMLVDANFVYWSKTGFLFLSMLLSALNFDYRFAVGVACTFWAVSLALLFGLNPVLTAAAALGLALTGLQVRRREVFAADV